MIILNRPLLKSYDPAHPPGVISREILPVYCCQLFILPKTRSASYISFILLAWYAFSSFSVYPDYLAYFNEIVGGPKNGHKYMEKNRIERIYLVYFGTDSPERYGIQYNWLKK